MPALRLADRSFNPPVRLAPARTSYSHVDAWDPITGQRVWTVPYHYVLFASMLATAGNLVFTGNPEGEFFALDAKTGNRLWSFQTGAGLRGGAVSYSIKGKQYIATTSGWQAGGAGNISRTLFPDQDWRVGSTMIVLALPNK